MKSIRVYIIALFIILVMVFDRFGDIQYGNYVFVLVVLASFGSLLTFVLKHWDLPFTLGTIFSLWSCLSLLWCEERDFSITRSITVILMQSILLVIASYSQTKYSRKVLRISAYAFLIGSGIMSILTLSFLQSGINLDLIQTGVRAETIIDNNLIGRMLALGAIVCLFFYLEKKNILYLVALSLLAVLIVILKTKGGLLSLGIGCVILLFVKYYTVGRMWRYLGIVLLLVFLFIAGLNSGIFGDAFIRFEGMFSFFKSRDSVYDDSTYLRLYYIQYGLQLIKNRPLVGYGIGAANYLLQGSYFHNNYIQLLVETGMIGFTLFYGMIIWLLRKLWKNRQNEYCMLFFSLMAVLMLSDISNTTYYAKLNYIIMGLSYVSIINATKGITTPIVY